MFDLGFLSLCIREEKPKQNTPVVKNKQTKNQKTFQCEMYHCPALKALFLGKSGSSPCFPAGTGMPPLVKKSEC